MKSHEQNGPAENSQGTGNSSWQFYLVIGVIAIGFLGLLAKVFGLF